MKVLLIVIGSLAGLYAAIGIVQMLYVLATSNPGTVVGGATIAGSVVPVCLGLARMRGVLPACVSEVEVGARDLLHGTRSHVTWDSGPGYADDLRAVLNLM
jgi:hypothetical protein